MNPTASSSSFFFGSQGQHLIGHYHRPALGGNMGRIAKALLICPPLGREETSSYTSLRYLAEQASQSYGIATLRLEYAYEDIDNLKAQSNHITTWIQSIQESIDLLKSLAPAAQIIVLGMHASTLLASKACATRQNSADIFGFIAIAPITSGRAYLRELRALKLATSPEPTATKEPATEHVAEDLFFEAGGWRLNQATYKAFSAIDLLADKGPAEHILLVNRDDLALTPKWLHHLRKLGAQVEIIEQAGYAAMMLDAHAAIIPEGMFKAILGWINNRSEKTLLEAPPAISSSAVPTALTRTLTQNIQETITYFGYQNALYGLLTEPIQNSNHKGLILLNAGATRLNGPHNLYVAIASIWARKGYTILRFDLGGLGNSPPRSPTTANQVYSPDALEDINAALTWLKQHKKCEHITLVGLCSGAYHAFQAALAPLDIQSVILINPLTFEWHEGMNLEASHELDFHTIGQALYYQRSFWQLTAWKRAIKKPQVFHHFFHIVLHTVNWRFRSIKKTLLSLSSKSRKKRLNHQLKTIAQTKIKQHYIFSAMDPGLTLLKSQAGCDLKYLKQKDLLSLDLINSADHTFSQHIYRESLIHILHKYLN